MGYGERDLVRGAGGEDVVELRMRLAGFRGTVPDGDFGPGTELQVTSFQRHWMRRPRPHGRVDDETFAAIDDFAAAHPIDFRKLACSCGLCGGFGQGKYKGRYRTGKPKIEA